MLKKYKSLSIVAKASLWALFANLIQRGMSIVATPIFTRILTTEEYAQYTLYQSWHDIFIIFASLNVFNYATYSAMKEYENDRNGFIATAQTVVTGLTFICFIVYFIIQLLFGNVLKFSMPIIILMFLDMLFFSSFNLWASKERYEFRYRLMTILSVIIGIMGPIIGIIAVHFSNNRGYGRIYGVAAINILIGLFIYIYNFKQSKKCFNKEYFKFIFFYSLPLIPHFLSSQVLTRFDRIMIDDMCGAAYAGIYSLAYSLSSLLMIVNDAILKSLTPLTYQTIKSGNNLDFLKKNVNFFIIIVAVANLLLILFAPEAVKIFAPNEYYEAIYIIPSVSASIYFMFLFNVFANIEYYYSETKYVAFASMSAAVANIVLNYIFINLYGYIAAGYTTLISYILYALGHYFFMKKVCKKHANGFEYYDIKNIFKISMVFVIISLMIIPLYKFVVIRYVLISLILIICVLKRKQILKLFKFK